MQIASMCLYLLLYDRLFARILCLYLIRWKEERDDESERQSLSFHPQCLSLIGPKDLYNDLFIKMKQYSPGLSG